MRKTLLAALLAATPTAAQAQTAAPAAAAPHQGMEQQQALTLERVFASPSLSGPVPREPQLSPDGRLVTLLRNRPDDSDRYDLWAVDAATGQSRMLVDSARFGGGQISEAERMRRERNRVGGTRGIVEYHWAPDGRSILVPLDGDLFLAGLNGNVRRLTETPGTELDAQVSKTGRFISFVRDQNLYVVDSQGGAERRLSEDGGGTVTWGTAEFVAQEEMDRHTGHWWSPGDRYVAVQRTDEAQVHEVTRTAIGAEGTRVFTQRYPAAGTPNAVVDLYVMRPDGSGRVKVDLGDNPDIYLARVDWSADGATLFVQRESRDQKRLDLLRVDPATGRSTPVLSETSRTWINLHDNFRPLTDGSMIWSSERSGFQHLYRSRNGRLTQLTRGDWVVKEVKGVDERNHRVYFLGNADGPLEQHLYWIDYERPAARPTRVTEAGWWNDKVSMDEGATRALIFRDNPTQPTQVYLADTNGRRLAWVSENSIAAGHPFAPYAANLAQPTFGTLRAEDGSTLNYKIITPPNMDPARRYPVLVQVYNGPGAGRQVARRWTSGLHQYLASRGWIVFSVDGRGSPDRGRAWEDQIYHAMGTVEVRDQLAGLEWLKRQPFVDPNRVAVFGWSYGGYMVTKLLEAAPGAYAAGVAGAPVTRWELYDTHYTERYLGTPQGDPQSYASSDSAQGASRIRDPLLLIHGMADDNVVFENSTTLMSALQQAGTPFDLMVYPGATHSVSGEARQVHLWRTITRFLDRATGAPGAGR